MRSNEEMVRWGTRAVAVPNDGAVAGRECGTAKAVLDRNIEALLPNLRRYARSLTALVVPVFDGSALYNVRFTDIKSEALSADGYQNFAGPTQACQIIREEIRRNPDQGEDTYQRGKVWYARLAAGDLMLPVRMEFSRLPSAP